MPVYGPLMRIPILARMLALAPPPAATGATGESPADTPDILRFRAPALAGGVLHGSDYAGTDVALWFWAPW